MLAIATDLFSLQAYCCMFKAMVSSWDSSRKRGGAKLILVDALLTTILPRNLNPANSGCSLTRRHAVDVVGIVDQILSERVFTPSRNACPNWNGICNLAAQRLLDPLR